MSTKLYAQHERAANSACQEYCTRVTCVLHINERSDALPTMRNHTFEGGVFNSHHRRCDPELKTPTRTN